MRHQPAGAAAAGQQAAQGMGAGGRIGLTQRHLGLGADGGDGGAQLMGGVGGEAAFGLHHLANALKQPVQAGQQRQGQRHGPQDAAQHCPQDGAADIQLLTHKHQHILLGTAGAEHTPGGAAQHQPATMPHLKDHPGCIAVQLGGIQAVCIVVVRRLRLLGHQQGGGLGQVVVQQLVQRMAGVTLGDQRGGQPECCHRQQQAGQQAALHGTGQQRHRAGPPTCPPTCPPTGTAGAASLGSR